MSSPPPALPEKAAAYFRGGYNCAQSVLLTMLEHYGIQSPLIPKIASAFGGGVGMCGSLCGALTGAVMAISLRHGTNEQGHEKREKAYAVAQRFYEHFTQKLGSPLCRDLIGYDLANSRDLEEARKANIFDEQCARFVKTAVEILLSLES
jgi:C_GCAxxG_C_C family probable redox protein